VGAAVAAAAVAVGIVAASLAARRSRDWGSTAAERSTSYPGDELIPEPADEVTRSVSIDAPPDVVWQWLVQIGQDRGGLYSYDWLENLFGLDIHSAEEIREEWQHLDVGDSVVLVPAGQLGLEDGYVLGVAAVEPDHHLVLRQAPPEHPWNAVWTFIIEPDGPGRSRLISRSRSELPQGKAAMLQRTLTATMEPITSVMTRRMLLGIKARAEGSQPHEATSAR